MAQVPYSGAPEVGPALDPLPTPRVNAPAEAFGTGVAGAISHLGEVAQGAGKELFARAIAFQELDEQTKADMAAAQTLDRMTNRYMEYDKLRGNERIEGMPKFQEDLSKIREDGAAGLNSPYARMQYLRDSRRSQSMMTWHGATLARQGAEEAAAAASRSRMDAAVNNFAKVNPSDPKEFDEKVAEIRSAAADEVHRRTGFAPGTKESDDAASPIVSGQVAKMIIAKLNADAPAGKKLYQYSKDKGLLSPEDADRLQDRVDRAVDTNTGRKIGATIGGDPKNKNVDPKILIEKAKAAADEADPGNDNLKRNAVDFTLERKTHEERIETEAYRETMKTLIRGVDGTDTNGRVPISLDEARQDPVWREAYDSAPEQVQGQIREAIRKNGNTDGFVPNERGNAEFNNLYAALKSPNASAAEVDEALNADLLKTHMTREQRKTILDLQNKVLAEQSTATSVNSAMNIAEVRTAVNAAGLSKGTEEYDRFVTEFTTAIGEYASTAHRTVKDHKQLGEIATQMLTQQATSHWYNPGSWGQSKTYENILEAKPELKAQAIKVWRQQYGTDPTPDQLASLAPLYYRKFFQELGAKSRPTIEKSTNRVPITAPSAPVGKAN